MDIRFGSGYFTYERPSRGCDERRGSSTVSTRDADGPVSAGGVVGGCSAGERVP